MPLVVRAIAETRSSLCALSFGRIIYRFTRAEFRTDLLVARGSVAM
jgi:hypothetical protein